MLDKTRLKVGGKTLHSIAENHHLSRCPKCRSGLKLGLVEGIITNQLKESAQSQTFLCGRCNIKWVLHLANTLQQSDNGIRYGHTLHLEAFSCKTGESLLGLSLHHNKVRYFSRLGEKCPDPKCLGLQP